MRFVCFLDMIPNFYVRHWRLDQRPHSPRFDFPRASKAIKTYTDDPSLSLTGFTAGRHTTVFLCDVSGLFGADHPENKAEI